MTERLIEWSGGTLQEHATGYPLGWLAEPEEIAPAFVFFASSDSDYVTGQILAIDGGRTM